MAGFRRSDNEIGLLHISLFCPGLAYRPDVVSRLTFSLFPAFCVFFPIFVWRVCFPAFYFCWRVRVCVPVLFRSRALVAPLDLSTSVFLHRCSVNVRARFPASPPRGSARGTSRGRRSRVLIWFAVQTREIFPIFPLPVFPRLRREGAGKREYFGRRFTGFASYDLIIEYPKVHAAFHSSGTPCE